MIRFRSVSAALLVLWVLAGPGAGSRAADDPPPLPREDLLPMMVLPVENLTGLVRTPPNIPDWLVASLGRRGVSVVPADRVDAFLARHRLRWTGGLGPKSGAQARDELGARSILVTSVEYVREPAPPRFAVFCRILTAEDTPRVVWAGSIEASGDEAPGFLSRNLEDDVENLMRRKIGELAAEVVRGAAGYPSRAAPAGRRFRPKRHYRSPDAGLPNLQRTRVAVLPFVDQTDRRSAGSVMTLHLTEQLAARPDLEVIEPGMVRAALLGTRTIPAGGISLPQGDLLKTLLGADVLLVGEVVDYREGTAFQEAPFVDFSLLALDASSRHVIWSSISYNSGDDGVVFFEVGRIHTAHALAARMARAVVDRLFEPPRDALRR